MRRDVPSGKPRHELHSLADAVGCLGLDLWARKPSENSNSNGPEQRPVGRVTRANFVLTGFSRFPLAARQQHCTRRGTATALSVFFSFSSSKIFSSTFRFAPVTYPLNRVWVEFRLLSLPLEEFVNQTSCETCVIAISSPLSLSLSHASGVGYFHFHLSLSLSILSSTSHALIPFLITSHPLLPFPSISLYSYFTPIFSTILSLFLFSTCVQTICFHFSGYVHYPKTSSYPFTIYNCYFLLSKLFAYIIRKQ